MKIFVAGASGAIGKQIVPQLIASGHEVVAMTRSSQRAKAPTSIGATPVVAGTLDRQSQARA